MSTLIPDRRDDVYRTDLSVAQPPCVKCRHAGDCDLPPTCHALRFFETTGKAITPPLIRPEPRRESLEVFTPEAKPQERKERLKSAEITAELAEALRAFQSEMGQGK